jgi:hypothetical protein
VDLMLLTFDEMERDIRLLTIDLDECRALSSAGLNEPLLPWVPTWAKSPWMFLSIGLGVGMYIAR